MFKCIEIHGTMVHGVHMVYVTSFVFMLYTVCRQNTCYMSEMLLQSLSRLNCKHDSNPICNISGYSETN